MSNYHPFQGFAASIVLGAILSGLEGDAQEYDAVHPAVPAPVREQDDAYGGEEYDGSYIENHCTQCEEYLSECICAEEDQ